MNSGIVRLGGGGPHADSELRSHSCLSVFFEETPTTLMNNNEMAEDHL